eukprot:CAMPEP_0172538968 /NCGR_PEP_ID=MMETSP1067-20121228/10265_1 /TAXON_ID=265564 ORGANISM="Thalassiosira punctigera, Strain Tpunct2005C2" /NCGR_SAMPLE_ID=MMETSP1067 /ASSEMBLY_ACC=CAM_ASM_000444 /LENGTH=72 /DNA_ID=CAMNT_0013324573 /DNA_START=1 /DNA_END=215 /DNA_ORIENTATION=+
MSDLNVICSVATVRQPRGRDVARIGRVQLHFVSVIRFWRVHAGGGGKVMDVVLLCVLPVIRVWRVNAVIVDA